VHTSWHAYYLLCMSCIVSRHQRRPSSPMQGCMDAWMHVQVSSASPRRIHEQSRYSPAVIEQDKTTWAPHPHAKTLFPARPRHLLLVSLSTTATSSPAVAALPHWHTLHSRREHIQIQTLGDNIRPRHLDSRTVTPPPPPVTILLGRPSSAQARNRPTRDHASE